MRNKMWDVIVIGGGPAGMMAAGRAAQNNKSVLLLEKNRSLGKKLLISGGGRCNFTNNKLNTKDLIESYKNKPKALYSIFNQFNVQQTLDFFTSKGMEIKEESEGRMFPITNRSQSVLNVLLDYMEKGNVTIETEISIKNLSKDPKNGNIIIETQRKKLITRSCVIATGGLSAPSTGSTGDGYRWLKKLGHEIVDNSLSLVPVALVNRWSKKLSGLVLQDIGISLWQNGKKEYEKIGKFLFTHFGASGPTILNMSSTIGELLEKDKVTIQLDLQPELEFTQLKDLFNLHLQAESNKHIKALLKQFITPALIPSILQLARIDEQTPGHSVSKEDRRKLIHLIKAIPLNVEGLLGADKAIVSAGGIRKQDVDFNTMESKIVKGIYIVGDLLNIDKPSGGYSLQLCWSTGYIAGENC